MEPKLFYCLKFKDSAKSFTVGTAGVPGRGILCSSGKSALKPIKSWQYPSIISYTSATTCSILILYMSIVKNIDQLCMHRRSSHQNSYNMSNSLWKLWIALPNTTSILNQIDGKIMLWSCIQKLASVIIGEV